MRILLFLLALLSAAPLRAAAVDEAAVALHACGRPSFDRQRPDSGGTVSRQLIYPRLGLVFTKHDNVWRYSMALDNERHMYAASGAAVVMPCLHKLAQAVAAREATPGGVAAGNGMVTSSVHAAAPVPADNSMTGAVVIGVVLLILLVGYIFVRERNWRNRPMRLCTNCYTTAQPLRHKNKRWYCGKCGADNPATLDSPIAQAFLAKQQATANPQLPQ